MSKLNDLIRPSGLDLIDACRGSAQMRIKTVEIIENDNIAATKGNAMHSVAAKMLSMCGTLDDLNCFDDEEREHMFDICNDYVDFIQKFKHEFLIESSVDCSAIMPGRMGTPDAYYIDHENKKVIVIDLKTGFKYVNEYKNNQLICYALCIILNNKLSGYSAELHIFQPATGEPRSWSLKNKDMPFEFQRLKDLVNEANTEGAILSPGSHCKYCTVSHECKAFALMSNQNIEYSFLQKHEPMNNKNLSAELRLLRQASKELEARLHVLSIFAEQKIKAGEDIPYFTLKYSKNYTKWNDLLTEEEIATKLKTLGAEPYVSKLKSPTQIKKGGIKQNELESLTIKQASKLTLTQINRLINQREFNDD